MATASALGGWLYTFDPTWPFWAVAILHTCALILVVFLKEPPIDTEQFSWASYKKQMVHGVRQLFAQKHDTNWIWQLLIISAFTKFLIEGIDPALALRFWIV
ncbi:hypothetical protein LRY60_06180 [Candidatus Woesebacteria bacterium]|nr:hypothetical protein [Candidatus Woesebacteria bacterium]